MMKKIDEKIELHKYKFSRRQIDTQTYKLKSSREILAVLASLFVSWSSNSISRLSHPARKEDHLVRRTHDIST